jgi:hypothetical protein
MGVADFFVSGYVEAGESVLSSPGLIWKGVDHGFAGGYGVAAWGDTVVFASNTDVYRSANAGVSFGASLLTLSAIRDIKTDGITWIIGSAGAAPIHRSTDDGATWTTPTTGPGAAQVRRIAFGVGGVVIAVGDASGSGIIFRSTDSGDTWTTITSPFGTSSIHGVAYAGYDGSDHHWVAVGQGGKIAHSSDNGGTFGLVSNSHGTSQIDAAAATGRGIVAAAGVDGKISRSADYGATWSPLVPAQAWSYYDILYSEETGRFHASGNGGVSWSNDLAYSFISSTYSGGSQGLVYLRFAHSQMKFYSASATSPYYWESTWLEAGSGIVEQGSNTNGHYVRFSSGLQMCWRSVSVAMTTIRNQNIGTYGWSYFRDTQTWTFPMPFASATGLSVVSGGAGNGPVNVGTLTATAVEWGVLAVATSASTAHLLAVGYWK